MGARPRSRRRNKKSGSKHAWPTTRLNDRNNMNVDRILDHTIHLGSQQTRGYFSEEEKRNNRILAAHRHQQQHVNNAFWMPLSSSCWMTMATPAMIPSQQCKDEPSIAVDGRWDSCCYSTAAAAQQQFYPQQPPFLLRSGTTITSIMLPPNLLGARRRRSL